MNRRDCLAGLISGAALTPASSPAVDMLAVGNRAPPTVALVCWGVAATLGGMSMEWRRDSAGRTGEAANGFGWVTRFVLPEVCWHGSLKNFCNLAFTLNRSHLPALFQSVELVVLVATLGDAHSPALTLEELIDSAAAVKKTVHLTVMVDGALSTSLEASLQARIEALRERVGEGVVFFATAPGFDIANRHVHGSGDRPKDTSVAQDGGHDNLASLLHNFDLGEIVNAALIRGLKVVGVTFSGADTCLQT
jgi:hypothetical protein